MNNIFLKARLKLTVYYIILICIILSIFSLLLYYNFTNYLKRDFENELFDTEENASVAEQGNPGDDNSENQTTITFSIIQERQNTVVSNAVTRFRNIILISDGAGD